MSGPGGSRIANERPGNGDALSLTFKTLEMLGFSSMLRTWWLGGLLVYRMFSTEFPNLTPGLREG